MAEIKRLAPIILGMAYVVPGTLFFITNAFPDSDVFAGLMVVGVGFYWQFMLVTRICHQQGFALTKVPQLGFGARTVPARLGRDTA